MAESVPELTPAQLVFVTEYAKDKNQVRAAIAAGLSGTYFGAAQAARSLLKNPQIRAALKYVFGVQARRLRTTVPDVVREWAIIGKSDLTDYVVDSEGRVSTAPGVPRSALRAVKKVKQTRTERLAGPVGRQELVIEVKTEIELHGKENALVKLYEHFGGVPGDEPGGAGVGDGLDVLGRLAALRVARRTQPGGAGPTLEPSAVAAEPGSAGGRVPQSGG